MTSRRTSRDSIANLEATEAPVERIDAGIGQR